MYFLQSKSVNEVFMRGKEQNKILHSCVADRYLLCCKIIAARKENLEQNASRPSVISVLYFYASIMQFD